MFSLRVSAHALHKAGTEAWHYEDAYAFEAAAGRAAVADGASDAFEAGAWARLLVTKFVHAPPSAEPAAFLDWLKGPARAWKATLNWEELPWYAEQKVREVGGLATMAGLWIEEAVEDPDVEDATGDRPTARWNALAVGDACLMHLRKDAVLARFPLESGDVFGNTPALLSTQLHHTQATFDAGGLRHYSGTCQVGDLFFLATDAMAEWLYGLADLEGLNVGLGDWEHLARLIETDFKAMIEELRSQAFIRNDDVTLLILRVVESINE
ncbi:MAG: hypothetical protein ACE5G0_07875 [Rhodothermales bacterium]